MIPSARILFFLLLGGVSVPSIVRAQIDYTFTATAGGERSWADSSNWNPVGVPGSSPDDHVTLAVPLQADLRLSLGTRNVALAGLVIGSTLAPVTSDLASGTGSLTLQNTLSDVVLVSRGVDGATNQISAPLILADTLVLSEASSRDVSLIGDLRLSNADQTIFQNMTGGQVLTIGAPGSSIKLYDASDPTVPRSLSVKVYRDNAGLTEINTVVAAAWEDNGSGGGIYLGAVNNNPAATFLMTRTQTSSADVQINRQGYVLAADAALGFGTLDVANNNNPNWGCEIRSDSDSRFLANPRIVATNNFAFTGPNSLAVNGTLTQRSNRVVGNNLAAGKELLLNGTDSIPAIAISDRLADGGRTWIMDGKGTTIVSGRIVNNLEDDATIVGSLWKRGTGRLELNNPDNSLRGEIQVQGGLVAFGADGAWGSTSGVRLFEGGGLAYGPGIGSTGFGTLAAKILPGSTGFLALTGGDASQNIDFASTLSHVPALSIGADGDVTYTGRVSPNPAIGYRWGGLSGTLTLNENASVGSNNVTYGSGGTVRVHGSQSYTGSTSIRQVSLTTAQEQIAARSGNRGNPELLSVASTLEVTSLADAGLPSALGASSSAPTNLVIDGGVLRVNADSDTSTNRLFTIGQNGAQFESSGLGAVSFSSNGGLIATSGTGRRTLTLAGTSPASNRITGILTNGTDPAADLLGVHKVGRGTWVLNGNNTYDGDTVVSEGQLFVNGDQSLASGDYSAMPGGTLGGNGILGGNTIVSGEGTLAPGNDLGTLSVTQDVFWNAGGNLNWQIHDADGLPGSGWDFLQIGNELVIEATETEPFQINLWSLAAVEPQAITGNAFNFRNSSDYTWRIASATGGITGFSAERFQVNVSPVNGTGGFTNPLNEGVFSVVQHGNDLNLVFESAYPTNDVVIDVPSGTQTQAEAGFPSIGAANSVTKTGAGTLIFNVANAYDGPTTVAAGTLAISDRGALVNTPVTVETGAMLAVAPGIALRSPSVTLDGGALLASELTVATDAGCSTIQVNSGTITNSPSLLIDVGGQLSLNRNGRIVLGLGGLILNEQVGGGRVDLGAGGLTVAPGGITASELRADIIAGRNGGAWNGLAGIMSTSAATSGGTRAVGYVLNGDGSALVSFASAGDTDLSGSVNVFDLVGINSSGRYGTGTASNWSQGDFNYDGVTNVFDLVSVNTAGSYGQGNYFPGPPTPPAGMVVVPEPNGLTIVLASLLVGTLLGLRRFP